MREYLPYIIATVLILSCCVCGSMMRSTPVDDYNMKQFNEAVDSINSRVN